MNKKIISSLTTASIALASFLPMAVMAQNPVPITTSIVPSSAIAGSGSFTITVNGANFIPGSMVQFNGNARTTTYVSSTQVTAAITAGDIGTPGTYSVTVFNPAPDGGTSNAQTFTVNNAVPTITGISPNTIAAGSGAFSLTVTGTNFAPATVVNFNGVARTTTYISATQVTAAIPASAVSSQGTFSVNVTNPGSGGGTSGSMTFTVGPASVNNPVPTLTSLSPSTRVAGSGAFTLTVNGANFIPSSVVRFNGIVRPTTYVSSTQVTAAIPASDIAIAETHAVRVLNPAPGGGLSNALLFTASLASTPPPAGGPTPGLPDTGVGPQPGTGASVAGALLGMIALTGYAIVQRRLWLAGK